MPDTPPNRDLASLAQEADRPIPPRYWWLKRFAVAALAVLLLMIISRWWWGAYASRALQAEIDKLKAAGEPTEARDFDLPPVPDELNAAIPLEEAVAIQARLDASKPKTGRLSQTPATMPEDPAQVQARAQDMARIRELVHQARLRPAVNWGFSNRSVRSNPHPNLFAYGHMIQDLRAAAVSFHKQGDEMAAFDTLEDMLSLGEQISAWRTLLAGLCQERASDDVSDALEEMLPGLQLTTESMPSTARQPIDRARLIALIKRLLDEQSLRDAIIWGMQSERFFKVDAIRLVATGQVPFTTQRYGHWSLDRLWELALRPMLQLDGVRTLRHMTKGVEIARTRNLPEANSRTPPRSKIKAGLCWNSRALSGLLIPNIGVQNELFPSLARRRMAAVAMAIRLYETDHGRSPETLDQLVPQYLPRVPENPLLGDASTIQYRLHCEHPCLYAPEQPGNPPSGKHPADVSWRFYLKGRPAKPSSTRPSAQKLNPPG